jgi:thiosulfate/3-mercaptopyruvate sulfurtransferase
MSAVLVSVPELHQLLGEVTILDVRYRTGGPGGHGVFAEAHLPGAAYVDMDTALAGEPGVRGRHPLPSTATFEAAMRRAGVSPDRPVVVYDDWEGRAAARAWWLLRFHGHTDVRVLDGGFAAWQRAGGDVETGRDEPAGGSFTAHPGQLSVIEIDEVLDFALAGVLVDARNADRYRGEIEPIDPVAGHIPGAVNVPTGANVRADGTFRPADELRDLYGTVVDEGAEVAAYCGSGVTATHDILAMAVAGIDAALYPGSWSEWVADPDRPVATAVESS